MAEKKISQLTAKGATVADTDLLVISESAGGGAYNTKSVTGANVKALVTDANLTTSDITTNDVSTAKHGFAPKAPNDATQFLDGTGAYDTVKDSDLSTSDITTNNVSTTKHGFAPKLPNDATKFLDGTGNYSTPAAGGLTKFTEAENTSAPNGTVYVDSLTAAGSSTDADAAIVPKGAGALIAAVPNNLTSGGNKRGQYAVDWQMIRNANTQVASGNRSVILGGYNNISSGTYAISFGNTSSATNDYSIAIGQTAVSSGNNSISLGYANTASNTGAVALGYGNISNNAAAVSLGDSNTASASRAVALGQQNTASGTNAFATGILGLASGNYSSVVGGYGSTASGVTSIAGGDGCVASATWAVALGGSNSADATSSVALGLQSSAFGIYGRNVFASGQEGTKGDSQTSKFVLRERTTGNTATTLTTNSSAASTNNQVILSNQSAYRFKGTIIGKKSGTTDIASWDVDGLIVRGANAAATTLNVSNVTLVENTPAWGTPTLAADTTNGGLQVQVTGAATTNIQWTAVIETTEVIYA